MLPWAGAKHDKRNARTTTSSKPRLKPEVESRTREPPLYDEPCSMGDLLIRGVKTQANSLR